VTPPGGRWAAHRFDTAAFATGGNACSPRIVGMGAVSGHHEHRRPSTRVATPTRRAEVHRDGPVCSFRAGRGDRLRLVRRSRLFSGNESSDGVGPR
jgi:hypothetical protein